MTASELLIHGLEATFWVSLLTILALGLRGPVTKRFGSRAAMLLWLMPGLRLIAPTFTRKVEVVTPASPIPNPGHIEPAKWGVPDPQPTLQLAANDVAAQPASEPLTQASAAPVTDAMLVYAPAEVAATSTASALPFASLMGIVSELITPEYMASLVLSLWFLGVLIASALCFARASSWRKTLLAEARDVPEELAKKATAAAERAGTEKPFTLVVSDAADTPQLMGLGKPVLALPRDFQDRYTEEEQEMALLHELTHLRRRDLSVLMASEAAFALQWFNPLSRHARKALRADQEAACDEAVRGLGVNTKSYAALLLKAASKGRPLPALTLDHSLKERIIRMQNPLSAPVKRYAFILTAGVSALAVAGFTASSTTVTAYVQEETKRSAASDDAATESWNRFLASLEEGGTDADERWAEYVAQRRAAEGSAPAVSDDEWAEARNTAAREGRAAAMAARDEARTQARENVRREWEQRRADRDRLRETSEEAREQAEEQRERAEEMRERAREQRRVTEGLRAEAHGARKVIITTDEGKAFKLRFSEDGDLMNADDLAEWAEEHDIDVHVESDGGRFSYEIGDGDGNIRIERLRSMGQRFATLGEGFDLDLGEITSVLHPRREAGQSAHSWTSRHGNMSMVLLGDPFDGLEQPAVAPPPPPQVNIEPPTVTQRETEEGTWILIPSEPDMSEFEASMEAFEEEMEAFGEQMEAWGEKMETAGETIEELAEACEDHVEETGEPKILSARVDATGKRIRALCVRGDEDRLASEEVQRFVRGANLSQSERREYRESLRLQ